MTNCSCSELLKQTWGTKSGDKGFVLCRFCDKPVYEERTKIQPNLTENTQTKIVSTFGTDMSNVFKEATIGFKLQLIWFVIVLLGAVVIGFGYVSGDLKVEKTPAPIESDVPVTNLCSESTGDCYDIDPTEPFVDEFPSRP